MLYDCPGMFGNHIGCSAACETAQIQPHILGFGKLLGDFKTDNTFLPIEGGKFGIRCKAVIGHLLSLSIVCHAVPTSLFV